MGPLFAVTDVFRSRERRTDVRNRRLARGRIQRRQFHDDFRLRSIQKLVYRCHALAENRFDRKPARVDRAAVAQRLDRHNSKRKYLALGFNQPGERAPDIAISDQRQFQKSAFSMH